MEAPGARAVWAEKAPAVWESRVPAEPGVTAVSELRASAVLAECWAARMELPASAALAAPEALARQVTAVSGD